MPANPAAETVHRQTVIDAGVANLVTVDDLEAALGRLVDLLDARAPKSVYLSEDAHREHHEWVRASIDRQRARANFWKGLANKSLPAIVATLILSALAWLWSVLQTHVTWNK